MEVERDPVPLIRINAPDVFAQPMFRDWPNRVALSACTKYRTVPTATWHVAGELPGELSDVIVVVDEPDRSNSDMPASVGERFSVPSARS